MGTCGRARWNRVRRCCRSCRICACLLVVGVVVEIVVGFAVEVVVVDGVVVVVGVEVEVAVIDSVVVVVVGVVGVVEEVVAVGEDQRVRSYKFNIM